MTSRVADPLEIDSFRPVYRKARARDYLNRFFSSEYESDLGPTAVVNCSTATPLGVLNCHCNATPYKVNRDPIPKCRASAVDLQWELKIINCRPIAVQLKTRKSQVKNRHCFEKWGNKRTEFQYFPTNNFIINISKMSLITVYNWFSWFETGSFSKELKKKLPAPPNEP